MVFLVDDGERLVRVIRGLRGRGDQSLQPNPRPQSRDRQRLAGVATGEKHVEALPVCSALGLCGLLAQTPVSERQGSPEKRDRAHRRRDVLDRAEMRPQRDGAIALGLRDISTVARMLELVRESSSDTCLK